MRRLGWAIAVGALAAASPAWADDAAQRDAQARFEEGVARARAGNLDSALASFQQAYAVIHKPVILWNLALMEEKTRHPVDALGHFKEYLRVAPDADADRPRAQKHIDALNAATGHVEVAAPAGAAIAVDGAPVAGVTPFVEALDVAPGHHDLEARLGSLSRTVAVEALAGQTSRADFAGLDAKGTAPGATAPQSNGEAPASAGDGSPATPPDQAAASAYVSPRARVVTVIALGGAALTSAGIAIAFGVASNNEADTASARRQAIPSCAGAAASSQACQQLASDVSAQKTDHVISTAMWPIAGTLALASVGAFFLWPKQPVTVVPAVGPGTAGLTVVGRF